MRIPLHICFIVNEYSSHFQQPEELLVDYFSLTDCCEALHAKGCKVSAIVRFKREEKLVRKGVDYYFVKDTHGPELKFWQVPRRSHQLAKELRPDVLHTHNMNKVFQHEHLMGVTQNKIPLVIQNHAEWPRFRLRVWWQKRVFKRVAALVFCAAGQEEIWKNQRIIKQEQVNFVMEGSTHFQLQLRTIARAVTGLQGEPVLLWVGNLDSNKDPLTVLSAFERLLATRPKARLYMIYRFNQLETAVKAYIAQSPVLGGSVFLLGAQKRDDLEAYYNSADYFILGSGREGSGYSLMEALACGCIPVVTDIPSFRMMTENGRVGPLWQVGQVDALELALQQAIAMPLAEARVAARASFERQLSKEAIADQLLKVYRKVLSL